MREMILHRDGDVPAWEHGHEVIPKGPLKVFVACAFHGREWATEALCRAWEDEVKRLNSRWVEWKIVHNVNPMGSKIARDSYNSANYTFVFYNFNTPAASHEPARSNTLRDLAKIAEASISLVQAMIAEEKGPAQLVEMLASRHSRPWRATLPWRIRTCTLARFDLVSSRSTLGRLASPGTSSTRHSCAIGLDRLIRSVRPLGDIVKRLKTLRSIYPSYILDTDYGQQIRASIYKIYADLDSHYKDKPLAPGVAAVLDVQIDNDISAQQAYAMATARAFAPKQVVGNVPPSVVPVQSGVTVDASGRKRIAPTLVSAPPQTMSLRPNPAFAVAPSPVVAVSPGQPTLPLTTPAVVREEDTDADDQSYINTADSVAVGSGEEDDNQDIRGRC